MMAVNVEKGKVETPVRISNSNEDVQTKAPKNRNNEKNSKKNGSNKKNDTNQDQTDLTNRPATPIVYESIDIEQPVVQTVAKRENRRSRRINKQKQSADPKTSQTGQTQMQIKHKTQKRFKHKTVSRPLIPLLWLQTTANQIFL